MEATNLSKIKREKMISFLESLKTTNNDDESIRALNEIENQLLEKKFGLVWEHHQERVDVELGKNIPIFTEIKEKNIKNSNSNYNFLLEGDNLHSLYLLEKTHYGKIDLIYIDPPYNTGEDDFIYNDNIVNKEDLWRHSKWLSFMQRRLNIAYKLLKETGIIIISIDDNEQAQLKLLCDEIFEDKNCIGILPTIMNLKGNQDQFGFAGSHEYTLIYAKDKSKCNINKFDIDEEEINEQWKVDDIGYYKKGAPLRATGSESKRENRPFMFYPILLKDSKLSTITENEFNNLYNKENKQFDDAFLNELISKYENEGYEIILPFDGKDYGRWRWGFKKENIEKLSYDVIFSKTKTGYTLYKKQRPDIGDLPSKKPKTLLYKPEYSSGNGTNQLVEILGEKLFNNPKPKELIKDFVKLCSPSNGIILDFFAGSGTTGQAVLEINNENGSNRQFILCTNNENKICENVTYERLKTVITGIKKDGSVYSNGISSNLKYYTTDWTPRKPEDYLLSNILLLHIKEMIELQNAIEIDNEKNVIIFNKDDFKQYISKEENYNKINHMWVNQNIVFTAEELQKLNRKGFKYIPKEFFGQELKEAAE